MFRQNRFGIHFFEGIIGLQTIIKGLYPRVNLTRLTITAAFSKEEMELAILSGAKQVESGH
jgi:hypothetical protein